MGLHGRWYGSVSPEGEDTIAFTQQPPRVLGSGRLPGSSASWHCMPLFLVGPADNSNWKEPTAEFVASTYTETPSLQTNSEFQGDLGRVPTASATIASSQGLRSELCPLGFTQRRPASGGLCSTTTVETGSCEGISTFLPCPHGQHFLGETIFLPPFSLPFLSHQGPLAGPHSC